MGRGVEQDHPCARKAVQFFVSNNLAKSTGLVNLSYSGVPEKYLDCG